jgi:glycosyltransferase involved in cell wall biosynthesis
LSRPKLLYLSCHESLEYDELKIFNELGFDCFSVGHYCDLKNPIHPSHDGSPIPDNSELFERFCKSHSYSRIERKLNNLKSGEHAPYVVRVKKDFADLFDVVYIGYYEENLTLNWESFAGKLVILRTIAQLQYHRSPFLHKIKTVSMSPKEGNIHGYKPNKLIRHAVDTNYHSGWVGETNIVLTVNKWLKKRGDISGWDIYQQATKDFNRVVCGFSNEDIEWAKTDISQSEIKKLRQEAGVYFSTCSKPGNLTYTFLEALSTGIPVVTIGPKWGNMPGFEMFEAHEFIENGVNGFWSDNTHELREYLQLCLSDKKLAKRLSENGRKTAIDYFSLERCKQDWADFFKENF